MQPIVGARRQGTPTTETETETERRNEGERETRDTHVRQQVKESIAGESPDRESHQQLQDVSMMVGSDLGNRHDGQESADADEQDGSCAVHPETRGGNGFRSVVVVRTLAFGGVRVVRVTRTRAARGIGMDADVDVDREETDGCEQDGWSLHPWWSGCGDGDGDESERSGGENVSECE